MKLSRIPTWGKGLCAVLACLFLGACVSLSCSAIQLSDLYGTNSIDGGVAGSPVAEEYLSDAWNLFVLSQHKESLTYLGQQRYDGLRERLDADNTNFRYRVLDQNGTFLDGNVEKGEDFTLCVDRVYDALYPAYASSDYVTVEEQTLPPEEVEGDWSVDSASSYAITEAEDTSMEATASDWAVASILDTDSDGDATTTYTYITYDRDYIDLPSKCVTTKSSAPRNGKVLEWGIWGPMSINDDLAQWQLDAQAYQGQLPPTILCAVGTGLLGLVCLIWLLAAVGHKNGALEVTLGRFTHWPGDLVLLLTICVGYFYLFVLAENLVIAAMDALRSTNGGLATVMSTTLLLQLGLFVAGSIALCLPLLTLVTVQRKAKVCWHSTLLYRGYHWLGKFLRLVPLHLKAFSLCAAYLLCYALLCFFSGRYSNALLLAFAFLMAVLALLALVWWLWGWSVLRKSSQALAAGDLTYTTDTTGLPWDLREHGDDLNAIGDGMQKAVEERMRSDRFRAELITNVSHDLKTPLTSIINYVDLMKKLHLDDPTAQQYIDVLDRKSQRLKTLTEDLIEASKASTGVLPVEWQRLEATQLTRQALAEYEEKLQAAQLRVVQRYPKEGAWILADGRHLWRILDNLLSNCAKYAMPGTRLYVDVRRQDGQVEISLKNISADPLNLPPEDLLRRFVRGDDARSTPGSGLGLSIAQSLATLQGATFQVEIDGDLFKALVRFPECPAEETP